MEIKVKLLEKSPVWRMTPKGFEVKARVTTSLPPGKITRIPTNLIIELPERVSLQLQIATDMPTTRGLLFTGTVVGDKGETYLLFYNINEFPVSVPSNHLMAYGFTTPMYLDDIRLVEGEPLEIENDHRGISTLYGDD